MSLKNKLKIAKTDDEKQQIQNEYERKTQLIHQNLQEKLSQTVSTQAAQFTEQSTATICKSRAK